MIGLSIGINKSISATDEVRALDAIRRNGGTVLRSGLIRNYFDSAGTTAATVDNPVGLVQDSVGSNNATQATVGSKPTLRLGLVNQLLNNQWGGGGTAPTGWNAVGAGGAEGVLLPSGMRQRVFSPVATRDYIWSSFTVLANTTYTVVVYVDANPSNLAATELIYAAGIPAGATLTMLDATAPTGSFVRMQIAVAATGGSVFIRFGAGANSAVTGTVTLSAPAIFTGTVTAQQIQAAGGIPLTTTAPASSALGSYWWQFDPAAPGDFFSTGITTGNEGWVCAGFRPAATGSQAMFSSGATSNVVAGAMLRLDSGTSPQVLVGNGTTRESISDSSFVASVGVPCVLEAGWTASSMFASANGNIGASQAKTVNCTSANTFSVGIATSASFPANGSMSAAVYCPTIPPAADRALIRKWVGSLQGQTL